MALTRLVLASYGLPALPLAAMYFPVFVFLAEFYSKTHGVSLAAIGLIFLLVRLFDAISDPLIGLLSDKWPKSLGRRRFWLVLACPVIGISAWNLFVPSDEAGLLWFCLWLTVLTFGWTCALTPYFAWGAELSGSYGERTKVVTWRESLGLIGTVIAALLYASSAGDNALGMRRVAVFVCIFLPIATLLCLRFVPEPKDLTRQVSSLRTLFEILIFERRFRILLLSFFLNGAANGVASALFLFYVIHNLGAPQSGGVLLVLYFMCAVLAAPLWPWLTNRFTKQRVWCVAMIYAAAIFLITPFLGVGDIGVFAVVCVLNGFALGADLTLPSAMQADLIDIDTDRNGSQRTGAFFALWSLVTKAALAISGGIVFIALGWIGFDPSLVRGNEVTAVTALALIYGLAPIALKLVAVCLMWDFPLAREEVEARRLRIERSHASSSGDLNPG